MKRLASSAPQTIDDWDIYIQELSDENLWVQSKAANTLDFVQRLAREGASPAAISEVLEIFALELQDRKMLVPERGEGSYLSYRALLREIQVED